MIVIFCIICFGRDTGFDVHMDIIRMELSWVERIKLYIPWTEIIQKCKLWQKTILDPKFGIC